MVLLGIILGCLVIVLLIDQLANNRSVKKNNPIDNMTKEIIEEAEDDFLSPEDIGLLDLKISEHMMLKLDYETIDIFYHKDNKYAVLCQTMGDRYTNGISVLPLKTPLNSDSLIITDKEVFTKAKKLFTQFKTNNKDKFINWG